MSKNKLFKFAENETFSCLIQPTTDQMLSGDHPLKGKWGSDVFHNDNPIVLELGCGKGEYTIALAQRNPDVNYIGVDIKGARLWKGAKFATQNQMPNVAFLRTRIDFIKSIFAPGEVSEIWITFADPQPKSANRRLTSPVFLDRYRAFLKPGGIVNLKTDSQLLHEYTIDVAREQGLEIIEANADIYGSVFSCVFSASFVPFAAIFSNAVVITAASAVPLAALLAALFAATLPVRVEAGDIVAFAASDKIGGIVAVPRLLNYLVTFYAPPVQSLYLHHLLRAQREHIGHIVLVKREPHSAHKHVCLNQICEAILEIERFAGIGQRLAGINVSGCLIIDAAFQLAALTRQLLRIERQILTAGRLGCDRLEICHKLGAAKWPAAHSEATDETGLLARPNLLHLYADVELFCKILDKLPEVHPLICNIVEDGLCTVTLELHVPDFHLQAESGSQLTGAYHSCVLAGDCLLPSLDIQGLGLAVYLLELIGLRIYSPADTLTQHHSPA